MQLLASMSAVQYYVDSFFPLDSVADGNYASTRKKYFIKEEKKRKQIVAT